MIRLVLALPAEARPLIEHFGLRRRTGKTAFPVYDNGDMSLIVSGVGKRNAAAAATYLHAASGAPRDSAWLNVGIAGSRMRALGEGMLAHSIKDAATKSCWYPPLVFEPPCETTAVLTLDRPASSYADACSVDMEAAGVHATACRFSTAELVHCFKIISDNEANPAQSVTAASAERLVAQRLDVIEAVVAELSQLAREITRLYAPPPELGRFLERWHFTVSERHKLRRLLQCWRLSAHGQQALTAELDALTAPGEVLALLERRLQGLPVKL